RVNTECYSCNGPTFLTVYSFHYTENQSRSATWDFANGIGTWGLSPGPPFFTGGGLTISGQPGQSVTLNSTATSVTPGASFSFQVTAAVNPISIGSGYFTLIWLSANGNEPSRETIMFEPISQVVATATTAADGSYSAAVAVDPAANLVT